MTAAPDLPALAAKLTKAQRAMFKGSTPIGCVPHSEATRQALVVRGYAVPLSKYQRALDWTPLGLVLRRHLLAEEGLADGL